MIRRPSADIMMKKSSKRRPIIGRPSPDASPMTKPLKIGGSVNETFNLGASTKKSSADQKICHNWCRRRPTIGRRHPIFPFLLTDRRATVGLANVTVVYLKTFCVSLWLQRILEFSFQQRRATSLSGFPTGSVLV